MKKNSILNISVFSIVLLCTSAFAGVSYVQKGEFKYDTPGSKRRTKEVLKSHFLGPYRHSVSIQNNKMMTIDQEGNHHLVVPDLKREWRSSSELKIYHELDWVKMGEDFRKQMAEEKKRHEKEAKSSKKTKDSQKENPRTEKILVKSTGQRLKIDGRLCEEIQIDYIVTEVTPEGPRTEHPVKTTICASQDPMPKEMRQYLMYYSQVYMETLYGKNTPEYKTASDFARMMQTQAYLNHKNVQINPETRKALKNGMGLQWILTLAPEKGQDSLVHEMKLGKIEPQIELKESLFSIPKGYKKVSTEVFEKRTSELRNKKLKEEMIQAGKDDIKEETKRQIKKAPAKVAEKTAEKTAEAAKDTFMKGLKKGFGF